MRRRYDILMVWSIDRLGEASSMWRMPWRNSMPPASASIATSKGSNHHANGSRHDPDGVGLWEQERSMLRSRVLAGLDRVRQQGKRLGRPKVSPKIENAIRTHLSAGKGILKVAALVGFGSGTVQRVKREMAEQLQLGACTDIPPLLLHDRWMLIPPGMSLLVCMRCPKQHGFVERFRDELYGDTGKPPPPNPVHNLKLMVSTCSEKLGRRKTDVQRRTIWLHLRFVAPRLLEMN